MSKPGIRKIQVIDSHTGGEPTRVVIAAGPELGAGPPAALRERFQTQFDRFRSGIVNEPRGSDVMVGAFRDASMIMPGHFGPISTRMLFGGQTGRFD